MVLSLPMATLFDSFLNFVGFNGGGEEDVMREVPNPVHGPPRNRAPLSPADAKITQVSSEMRAIQGELQKTVSRMEQQAQRKMRDARDASQKGKQAEAKRILKALVSERRSCNRIRSALTRITTMENRALSMQANAAVVSCAKKSLEIIRTLNHVMDPADVKRLAISIGKESERLAMAQGQMDSVMDMLDEDEEAGEEDGDDLSDETMLAQLHAEANIAMDASMPHVLKKDVPHSVPPIPAVAQKEDEGLEDDAALATRFLNLKKKT